MRTVLIDTDILVDLLRGNARARTLLEENEDRQVIASITVAELYAGSRNKKEAGAIAALIGLFEVIALDDAIAESAGLIRRRYGASHGTGLADAIIAATALAADAQLATRNRKHYPMFKTILGY